MKIWDSVYVCMKAATNTKSTLARKGSITPMQLHKSATKCLTENFNTAKLQNGQNESDFTGA